jgi:hypothetical protein
VRALVQRPGHGHPDPEHPVVVLLAVLLEQPAAQGAGGQDHRVDRGVGVEGDHLLPQHLVRQVGDRHPHVRVAHPDPDDQAVLARQADDPPPPSGAVGEHLHPTGPGELAHDRRDRRGRQAGLAGHLGLRELAVQAQDRHHPLAVRESKR